MPHTVITVATNPEALQPIEPVLQRSTFEVHRVAEAAPAVELCRELPKLDLLVAGVPLDVPDLGEFVREVRKLRAPTPPLIVLLARNADFGHLERVPDEHVQILSLNNSPESLQRELLQRFGRRPRVAQRVLVRLEVHLEASSVLRACQTHNLSETGMAVRTREQYPVGTMVEFSLSLENDTRPVQGMAEVVRHIELAIERIRGIGLRFLRFRGDGQERLQAYMGAKAAL